jgi:hypothetical protein
MPVKPNAIPKAIVEHVISRLPNGLVDGLSGFIHDSLWEKQIAQGFHHPSEMHKEWDPANSQKFRDKCHSDIRDDRASHLLPKPQPLKEYAALSPREIGNLSSLQILNHSEYNGDEGFAGHLHHAMSLGGRMKPVHELVIDGTYEDAFIVGFDSCEKSWS